jgi:enoyl-CoA hydratase
MMSEKQILLVEDRDYVRIITLNRPDRMNALNIALSEALIAALADADQSEVIRAVILMGAGRAFCSGADTSEFKNLTPDQADLVEYRARLTGQVHGAIPGMSTPVIGAVRGYALGGGAGLAMACDMVIASETAQFGYPEVKHGLVAATVLPNLTHQIGRKAAFELVATGRFVDAAEARVLGMVNRVVPDGDLLEAAMQTATLIGGYGMQGMTATKRLFYEFADLPLKEGLTRAKAANQAMRAYWKDAK